VATPGGKSQTPEFRFQWRILGAIWPDPGIPEIQKGPRWAQKGQILYKTKDSGVQSPVWPGRGARLTRLMGCLLQAICGQIWVRSWRPRVATPGGKSQTPEFRFQAVDWEQYGQILGSQRSRSGQKGSIWASGVRFGPFWRISEGLKRGLKTGRFLDYVFLTLF